MFSFKNNKLFIKVFRLLFVGIILISVTFGFIGITLQKQSILELLHSGAKSLAQSITFISSDALIIDDNSYLIEFNSEYIKKNENIKNVIIAKNDGTYFNIKKNSWSYEDNIPNQLKLMQKNTESYKILYSEVLKEEVFHYTYPIYFSGISWGWLHLSFDLKEYNERTSSMYLQFLSLLISLTVLFFIIAYYIAKSFSGPIIELNKAVSSITSDNLDVRVDASRDDEIGELSNAFNNMIFQLNTSQKRLKTSHENLEKRVNERTAEIKLVNESLEEKSQELRELNKNLDTKVKLEIETRRKQEEMLLQQSRLAAMGEMVGNIAHQWRQPLNALSIIIQNIGLSYQMDKLNKEFVKKSVEESMDLTTMMSKTIDDFRHFFMPNKKKEDFLLSKSLNSSLKLIGSTFKNYDIEIYKNIEEDLFVTGFPNEFAQALLNVLSNAKDALIEKRIKNPEIHVSLKKDGNTGVICIKDNAKGIDKSILNKIFEPYFTTKEQGHGTGIGLYMSKIIIEQNMKGKIYAENIDDGAAFIIEMPLKEEKT